MTMNIVVGICGSISAYKSYELCRGLVKNGHKVKVIFTKGAEKFIHPATFDYLGMDRVYRSGDDFIHKGSVLHIDLARWLDLFLIYPLSANTLSKLAAGSCDDLLTSVALSCDGGTQHLYCVAMNTMMLKHQLTQKNLQRLHQLDHVFCYPPSQGQLACGEVGEGKIPEPQELLDVMECFDQSSPLLSQSSNVNIAISTGAAMCPIDTVRYLTNPSSGLTGFLIAQKLLAAGYFVHLIHPANDSHGINFEHLKQHPRCQLHKFVTNENVLETLQTIKYDYYISAAALNDMSFDTYQGKLKKDAIPKSLEVNIAVDVLKWAIMNKSSQQTIIGFAAEDPLTDEVIKTKLKNKPVDLLITNPVKFTQSEKKGFQNFHNSYRIFDNQGTELNPQVTISNKQQLAQYLQTWITSHLSGKKFRTEKIHEC